MSNPISSILVVLLFLLVEWSSAQNLPKYQSLQFKQRLDHYDFSNEETFMQRYFISNTFVKSKIEIKNDPVFNQLIQIDPFIPIIAYPGNEGKLEDFYENTGLVFELAKKYNALIVFIEHRYYGKSIPKNGNIAKYLTIEQAINDYALFFTENFGLDENRKNPIILVGGSYGGDLAAWMRFKFPHLIDGSIAASAPILFFNEITAPNRASQIVTEAYRNLTNYQIYPHMTCDSAVKKGFDYLLRYFTNPSNEQLQKLSKKFKLCTTLQTNDVKTLGVFIAFAFEVLAQANYPYPTNFFGDLPAWPVNGLCTNIASQLVNAPNLENEDLFFDILYSGTNLFQNYSGSVQCFNISNLGGGALQWNSWSVQLCNEMINPIGFYPKTDMFFSYPYSLQDNLAKCKHSYPSMTPQPNWLITYFGGKRALLSHSNIIFSNGQYDAVRAGGVELGMKTSNSIIPLYIEQGAHHLDIRFPNENDPQSVRVAREIEMKYVGEWINQFLNSIQQ